MKNNINYKTGYVYSLSPIDFDWEFMPKLSDYLLSSSYAAEDLLFLYKAARECAKYNEVGMEREAPRVMFLPNDQTNWNYAIAWKTDNNGTSFLASGISLDNFFNCVFVKREFLYLKDKFTKIIKENDKDYSEL